MHTVGHHGFFGPFGGLNEPQSEHTPHFDDFRVIQIPTSKMPNFFVDVRQDLVYEYGWPLWIVRAVWRVKQAPKRAYASFRRFSYFLGDPDSDVKMPNIFVDVRQDLIYGYGFLSRLV